MAKKRPVGRPRLSVPVYVVPVRITLHERRQWGAEATQQGTSLPAYIAGLARRAYSMLYGVA